MSSLLIDEEHLEFEKYSLNKSIENITVLIKNLPPDLIKAHDYYNTIKDTLIAVSFLFQGNEQMRKSFDNMAARVTIMEKLLELHIIDQNRRNGNDASKV